MTAVAEGIESVGELEFLRAHGCPVGQGFYFAKPVPAEEIRGLVAQPGDLLTAPTTG
ncbi:MAG: hypothetical protein ACXWXG_02885 [Actinomycetota bacterium]